MDTKRYCIVCETENLNPRSKFCCKKCEQKYYYQKNKEQRKEYKAKYYQEHKEEYLERKRNWIDTHKDEWNEYYRNYNKNKRKEDENGKNN